MKRDFVSDIKLMVALARSGELECFSDHTGIHIKVKGEEVASLSLNDRPDVKLKLDETRIAISISD